MPKHCSVPGIPVEVSLQLVPDGLGLPDHGGESWTVLSKKVKGTVSRSQARSTVGSKMQWLLQGIIFSIHYVGKFNFFLKLWLSLSFDASHNFQMAVVLEWYSLAPSCVDWQHLSPKPLCGAQQRVQSWGSTCKCDQGVCEPSACKLSRRIDSFCAPWLTDFSGVWVRH